MHQNQRRDHEWCQPERTEPWRGHGDQPVCVEILHAKEGKRGERVKTGQRGRTHTALQKC